MKYLVYLALIATQVSSLMVEAHEPRDQTLFAVGEEYPTDGPQELARRNRGNHRG